MDLNKAAAILEIDLNKIKIGSKQKGKGTLEIY